MPFRLSCFGKVAIIFNSISSQRSGFGGGDEEIVSAWGDFEAPGDFVGFGEADELGVTVWQNLVAGDVIEVLFGSA